MTPAIITAVYVVAAIVVGWEYYHAPLIEEDNVEDWRVNRAPQCNLNRLVGRAVDSLSIEQRRAVCKHVEGGRAQYTRENGVLVVRYAEET